MMKRNDDYQGLINAVERRVRELEAQVCALAIQVAALAARGVPTYPGVPYMPSGAPSPVAPALPLRYEITCGPAVWDTSYGGTQCHRT